jgi:tetratricopeptide (TPR) repeat protein
LGRATVVSQLVQLASVPAVHPPESARDCEEALRIAREIDSAPDEAWAFWVLGLLHTVQGQFGRALDYTRHGLGIALDIGHREWEVGNRSALGVLYNELFAPEHARRELERALTVAGELQSQYWIRQVSGALAGVYLTLDEQKLAQASLETVISPQTPMDTMGKRYCWARRAELTLAQGDPALALDITDRLVASAPGMAPGRVITFLWKLKGEVLAASGRTEAACSLLHAAIENAQAAGERFLLWRVHASLGRLYRTMGQQEVAEKEFSAAYELIGELAATIPDEALKSNFLQGAYNALDLR